MNRGRGNIMGAPARSQAAVRAATKTFWPKPLEYPAPYGPIFLLFLGYVLFFYLQGGYRFEFLGRIRFELIAGVLLLIGSLLTLSAPRTKSRYPRSNIIGWVYAMVAMAGVMTVLSYSTAISWPVFLDRVVKFSTMTLFIGALVTTPDRLRWFLGAYLLAFLKMAQEGVLGLITGSLVWQNQGTMRLHGATPNYAHPNSFSGTQLVTLPFLRFLAPLAPKYLQWVLIAQAVGAIFVVVTTGSRTGYVALALWLFFLWAQSNAKFKSIFLSAIAAFAILPFIPTDYINRFETIFTQKDEEGASIDMRKEILRDAWAILAEYPLGVGVGAFSPVRQKKFGRTQHTHNLYLEVACDMGIQGLAVFLGFVLAMITSARRTSAQADRQMAQLPAQARAPPSDEHSAAIESHRADLKLIKATAQAVLSFLVIRLGLGLFGHDFYEIYWWFAAGLLIALHRMLGKAEERTQFLASTAAAAPETAGSDSAGAAANGASKPARAAGRAP